MGYLLPARGTPGVSPDGESCWDAAAAVIWNFRLTFWLGNYIWTLFLWNWALVEALDTLRPGFCTEFQYLSYGQSGFACGAIFEKNTQILGNVHFFKNVHVQKIQKCHFSEKKTPEAQRRTQPVAFKNTGVYIYIYIYIYIHVYI